MRLFLYSCALLLVPRASSSIVDCSDFCATYWDLPLAQERLRGESANTQRIGTPEFQVGLSFFIQCVK